MARTSRGQGLLLLSMCASMRSQACASYLAGAKPLDEGKSQHSHERGPIGDNDRLAMQVGHATVGDVDCVG